jgi:3-methyladenine DNA glycosylase AlkC
LPDTEAVSSTFAWWPLCTFVERHGQQHPDVALPFLRRLTRTFSAEFAIRPFLANAPQETLAVLASWLEDPDPHVRRWISEGTRPRLPWGQHLPAFTADPALTLPLLDALRSDPEPYVRRSVANHLGDIAKDHPDRAIAVARRWVGHTTVPPRGGTKAQQLVRHALRHLVKQGHPDALALMGFLPPAIQAELTVAAEVQLGGTLRVELTLTNPTDQPQPMLVDLGIRFRGADGSLRRPKVFKWTTLTLEAGQTVSRVRQQRLPDVTTRTHHGGHQEALARVNGQTLATATFRLAL